MTAPNGGPAFPTHPYVQVDAAGEVAYRHLGDHGISARDFFAANAPLTLEDAPAFGQGNPLIDWVAAPDKLFDLHARLCYQWADAMLKARSQ